MRARNKFLLSAVMMTLLSSTMAMPSTWAAAGLNSEGRIFATTADSKFKSTGSATVNGVVASNGGQVTIGSLDTPNADKLPKRYRQPAFITGMLDNSSIQVDGGVMDVTTAPWTSPYPLAFAYNSKINIGIDDEGTVKHKALNMQGDVLVTDKTMPPYQQQQPSVINIGLGRAHNSPNQFSGKAVNTLEDKGGEINMTFDGGMWSHDNMGGLESFMIDGKEARSSINTLTGTRTREGFSRISQDSRSDIHVNKLDGHINVIYDMSASTGLNFGKPASQKTGLDAADIEGGNFIVKSAAAGSGVHGYVTGDNLDTSSESNVNKILDNLAHKFYYENYVKGERNLSGTVSIASKGIVSSYKKALTTDQKEGDITWKDGNGLFIQPYAKLSALTLEGVDYQLNGVDVHSDSYNSVLGEAGTRVGYDFAVGNATVKPYLNLAALNEFSDGNKVRLGDESVNASIDGAAFRVGAGVQADITKNMGAYASLDYTKGDDIENPLQGVVGINVTW